MDFHLDNFDGPLDLLLHLISKNKVSIYDIPIAEILEQYMAVLHEAEHMDLDVAGDFIAMAAQRYYPFGKLSCKAGPRPAMKRQNPAECCTEQIFG